MSSKHPLSSVALGRNNAKKGEKAGARRVDNRGLGCAEVRVRCQDQTEYGIRVQVEYRKRMAACPYCGRRTARVHSRRLQVKRDRRLRDRPVYLELSKRRFRCHECGQCSARLTQCVR